MKEIGQLTVKYGDRVIGTLAETKNGMGAFQYSKEWLLDGFSISPFSLPLEERVFIPKIDVFEGVFGVFADSLPDEMGKTFGRPHVIIEAHFTGRSICDRPTGNCWQHRYGSIRVLSGIIWDEAAAGFRF